MTSAAKGFYKIHVSRTSRGLHVPAVTCGNRSVLCADKCTNEGNNELQGVRTLCIPIADFAV